MTTDIASDLLFGSPAITDDLLYADGTVLTGQALSNGDVWQCSGTYGPVVVGRKITNPNGNTYPGFPNVVADGGTPQLVKAFGTSVRFVDVGLAGTLIAEKWSAGPLDTMVHYNFGPDGWGLKVMFGGVPAQTWSGEYTVPLFEWRHVSMEINGNDIILHHPDGTSTLVTSSYFGMAAPTGVRFQLCAGTNVIEYAFPWCGGNRAAALRAVGDGASSQQAARLETFVFGNVAPISKTLTDNTWTDIAVINVDNGKGTTVFEIDACVDMGSYAVGYAYAGGKWMIPVTGRSGGSVFAGFNPAYYHDSWNPGNPTDPLIALNVQAVNQGGGVIKLQAKATQVNGSPTGTTHPIVWESHKRGDRSAKITPV